MSNMSYCKFRNTLNDLQDCAETIEENDFDVEQLKETLSHDEFKALESLIEVMGQLVDGIREVQGEE